MLSKKQKRIKRGTDIILSFFGIIIFITPIFILFLISTLVNKEFGFFSQQRVGLNGEIFKIYKIKSMKSVKNNEISPFGAFIRRTKLDELPQVFNVFLGQMSIVGPRPDIVGYADLLKSNDKVILSVKPGLTSLATLKFVNEEKLLEEQQNPVQYNDEVLWPQKVALNKLYVINWSLQNDFKIILKTVLVVLKIK